MQIQNPDGSQRWMVKSEEGGHCPECGKDIGIEAHYPGGVKQTTQGQEVFIQYITKF